MASKIPPPAFRKLRGYAIDPSLSTTLSTMQVNELVYKVPWEKLGVIDDETSGPYPVGDYVEIVDYDPATGRFYEPVNLDDAHLLAQDGHPPSVSNPQFHQQMVYAVIMTTIKNFERALGRKIQWGENFPIRNPDDPRKVLQLRFVRRLRVYPHALRQANAFYDPNKKALLFGYFQANPANAQLQLPGGTVFTCLSHDIIAHETTHAILDGLHRRYINATHPDTRAFHEAFADIVALLQHFTFPELLKHQIAQTRGDLKEQNLLWQLAMQFGKATGSFGSLRDAIGSYDDNDKWVQHDPDPKDYETIMSPHKRGGILVATVFDVFVRMYEKRIQKLMRIASGGTGLLPDGALHPDLIDELSKKASSTASYILQICVRALDYCPPFDITFGDYLRAAITADIDMVADDSSGYRIAFIEAFQRRGISAAGIKSMSVEELMHEQYPEGLSKEQVNTLSRFLRRFKASVGYLTDRNEIYNQTKEFVDGKEKEAEKKGETKSGLQELFENIVSKDDGTFAKLTGLMFPGDKESTEAKGLEFGYKTLKIASFVVGNLWLANRVSPNGNIVNHVILTLVQKRGVRFEVNGDEVKVDGYFVDDLTRNNPEARGEHNIRFNGGCTLIFDLDTMKLRYAIKKDIDDQARMIRQFKYENSMLDDEATTSFDSNTYFDRETLTALAGPFAFMHSHSSPDQ